ncbi:futalosine hydrolase [Parapedobacter lycopersici]|uniref:futalosine hydrolase n=1 Tax=Parapedobacter lycopersici TaxID=1864939 RepID=UPI00214D2399|nr:futalosine hydrolase [Parapedobacter lycopersici]
MENTLIIAATAAEIAPFMQLPAGQRQGMDVLITGVGMVATAFALGKQLTVNHYDLLLNVGICGSFNRDIPLGEVVHVHRDTFAELGAEDGAQFVDSETLGLATHTYYSEHRINHPEINRLHQCKGITVNRVHGDEQAIEAVVSRIHPDTESMEGAAVFYAAHHAGLPAVQVRAVSNYVERRNKNSWRIPLAIENLNRWLITFARSGGTATPPLF